MYETITSKERKELIKLVAQKSKEIETELKPDIQALKDKYFYLNLNIKHNKISTMALFNKMYMSGSLNYYFQVIGKNVNYKKTSHYYVLLKALKSESEWNDILRSIAEETGEEHLEVLDYHLTKNYKKWYKNQEMKLINEK